MGFLFGLIIGVLSGGLLVNSHYRRRIERYITWVDGVRERRIAKEILRLDREPFEGNDD